MFLLRVLRMEDGSGIRGEMVEHDATFSGELPPILRRENKKTKYIR